MQDTVILSSADHKIFARLLRYDLWLASGYTYYLLTASLHQMQLLFINAGMSDLALPQSRYTRRVLAMAIRVIVEDGLPYRTASLHF